MVTKQNSRNNEAQQNHKWVLGCGVAVAYKRGGFILNHIFVNIKWPFLSPNAFKRIKVTLFSCSKIVMIGHLGKEQGGGGGVGVLRRGAWVSDSAQCGLQFCMHTIT